jgi:pyruvate/2-oxoglutarate dehydrogenase complex dihydrolipoamide dehydrogenase (E3) component
VHGARDAAATAEVDVDAALAWRDFMVSDDSDAGQERWLAGRGIDLLRGTGRLAGTGVVEVDGVRRTAEHVVVATACAQRDPASGRNRADTGDGERLTGAYALGPEAGEWLQQATLAIRAHVSIEVMSDTIQPFPSFSGIYDAALMELRMQIADMPRPVTPMDAQMARIPREEES